MTHTKLNVFDKNTKKFLYDLKENNFLKLFLIPKSERGKILSAFKDKETFEFDVMNPVSDGVFVVGLFSENGDPLFNILNRIKSIYNDDSIYSNTDRVGMGTIEHPTTGFLCWMDHYNLENIIKYVDELKEKS